MRYDIRVAATKKEKEAIYRFRYHVYIEEMQKTHIQADHETTLLFDDADSYMVLYYACINDKLAATVRSQRGPEGNFTERDRFFFLIDYFEQLFDHSCLAIVDKLIVDIQHRNSLLAHEMMVRTYVDGWKSGTRLCFITCDDQLLSMYLRYGFRTYAAPILLPTGEKRHRLLLFLCDKEYLKKVRSPFQSHLPDELDDKGSYAALVNEKTPRVNVDLMNQIQK